MGKQITIVEEGRYTRLLNTGGGSETGAFLRSLDERDLLHRISSGPYVETFAIERERTAKFAEYAQRNGVQILRRAA